MKVRQFLNKMFYASSTIYRIYVVIDGEKTRLIGVAINPMETNTPYDKQLDAEIVSFRITDNDMTIYAK